VFLKTAQIVIAASIPVIAIAIDGPHQRLASAILGALVGVLEGVLQVGQHQQNWLLYRATREALKREELLFQGKAGPYVSESNSEQLFVERCDAIISGENAKWLGSQDQRGAKK
jgi:hypothetical protein